MPSRVLARWAKMSRMSALRSSTVVFKISSSVRVCEGVRSLSKMTMFAPVDKTSWRTSSALPSPMNERGSGVCLFCRILPAHSPPAVLSRASSSSSVVSVAVSSFGKQSALRPTSTARSIRF